MDLVKCECRTAKSGKNLLLANKCCRMNIHGDAQKVQCVMAFLLDARANKIDDCEFQ